MLLIHLLSLVSNLIFFLQMQTLTICTLWQMEKTEIKLSVQKKGKAKEFLLVLLVFHSSVFLNIHQSGENH